MGILDFLTGSPEDSAAREQREARQHAGEDSVKRGVRVRRSIFSPAI